MNPETFEPKIIELLQNNDLAHAEVLLRSFLKDNPQNPKAHYYLGIIAMSVNLPDFASLYFKKASSLAPLWQEAQSNLEKANEACKAQSSTSHKNNDENAERFLVIKAWGAGFGSDLGHLLGALLLAEITHRNPIIHWGSNSLFGDGTENNAFEFFFENISTITIKEIQNEQFDFWPPKWNHENINQGEVNKLHGPYSRMACLYLLNRPEKVIVSDFFSSVMDLMPWIPSNHPLHKLSVDALYTNLVSKYLRPRKPIQHKINQFFTKYLSSTGFIAIHVRGSDKALEIGNLDQVNQLYKNVVDQYLSVNPSHRIFLMTDDARIKEYFIKKYRKKVISTDCQRTYNNTGVHFLSNTDGRKIGTEMLIDIGLAAKANVFLGNGLSNASLIVRYFKDWPQGCALLIGQNLFHRYSDFIY